MLSFSKALSFLMAFAVTSSITTTTVDAACECVGHQAGTDKIFADEGFPSDFGEYCRVWEVPDMANPVSEVLYAPDHPCAVGGADYGADYCSEPWCYIAADNTCDDALDTATFASSTTLNTLQFSNGGACGIDTCGQCLPIMEGDEAVIGVRLYRTSLPAEEYMAMADEIFTPFYSTQPGFISYTGATTQDPDIFLFVSIFDTEENHAAVLEKGKSTVWKSDPDEDELLNIYNGRITWTGDDITGTTDNCVKSFDVGDYLSSRLFDNAGNNQYRPPASGVSDKYTAWTAVESFDSYTASVGMGELC